ncbi:hypothetical protein CMK18_21150 [Candidatus Poribacteria bacterium]|nr:hypothetical protein [Candidatus Poribacteria bacterium]
MLVNPGEWEHVSWSGDFKCSSSGLSNDNGEFIKPVVTSSGSSKTTTIESIVGRWDWEMQEIEMTVNRRWLIGAVGRAQQWVKPADLGDIKEFTQKTIQTGTLDKGQSITFNTQITAASDGGKALEKAKDVPTSHPFYQTQMACAGNRSGWEEIQWPAEAIPGVESLKPREAGKQGCSSKLQRWPLGVVWGYGPKGATGKRSILCFKFTRR